MNKKHILISAFIIMLPALIFSQLKVTTNDADATYASGQSMNFVVSGGYGTATYTIHYDHGVTAPIEEGTIQLNGSSTNIPFRGTEPSVVICTVTNNGQTAVSGAAFSPFDIEPYEEDPVDYDAFWQRQKNELAGVPINPRLTPITTWDHRTRSYRINLGQVDGRRVYGYLSIPLASGNYPAIITHAAFGVGPNLCIPRPEIAADIGAISLSIWMHDAEPDQQAQNAYFPKNWDDPENNYFRYGVLGILRAIDYVQTMPEFDGQNIGLNGISEGGGMSIIAAGIDSRVKAVSASIFAHGEHSGYKYGRASGFPYYMYESTLTNPNISVENINQGAKYFDALRAAKRFNGSFLGSVGYNDLVSIPATNFAVFNQFKGPKTLIHKIGWGHTNPDEFYLGKFEFFRKAFDLSGQKGYAANAGNDQFINDNNANLSAIIEKNGQINTSIPGTWKVISGPATVSFSNDRSRNTVANFSTNGEYILSYIATDESALSNDETYFTIADQVKITVQRNGGQITDADGDGVPASSDCNDNNPNISNPGDPCNDFNSNTTNDVIQADCSCAGVIVDLCTSQGGDSDGDGVCDDEDCNRFNPNISRPGDPCNDFNSNTTNDVIQADCSCAGVIADPCASQGGDSDGDGVCDDEDCNRFNPNISVPGDPCNDFNSNTTDDVIQEDCSCAGTQVPPPPTNTDCTTTYLVNGNEVTISPLNYTHNVVNIFDSNFGIILSCQDWDSQCDASQTFTLPYAGLFFIQIQTFTSWDNSVCSIFEAINAQTTNQCSNVVDGGNISGNETICSGDNPSPIISSDFPSGGSGAVEYLWLSSTSSCPINTSDAISGANQSTYTPTEIFETTYFRRLSRRAGCTEWDRGSSNCIVKYVDDCGGSTPIADCEVNYSVNGNRVRYSNLTAPITTIKILQDSRREIYHCGTLTGNPCPQSATIRLTPGKYNLQILSADDWEQGWVCNIFENFDVNGNQFLQSYEVLEIAENSLVPVLDLSKQEITVFPNPANDVININLGESANNAVANIELINQLGAIVKTASFEDQQTNLQILTNDLVSGIYFLKIEKEDSYYTERIIINR